MTCEELRLHFEDVFRQDRKFAAEAEHLAHCSECACFVETQRELGRSLEQARENCPAVSPALDALILSEYQKQIASRLVPRSAAYKRPTLVIAGLAVATAVLLIVIGAALFPREPIAVMRPPESASPKIWLQPGHDAGPLVAEQPSRPEVAVSRPRAQNPAARVNKQQHPWPANFLSLMYCDEFSCGGTLTIIRVRLQPSIALGTVSTSSHGAVLADVLVGPDGIARGIRIVE